MPDPSQKRGRGHPKVYTDRLIVKASVIMMIRRLYSAYSLLAFLDQDTELTRALQVELTDEQGRFPSRRTWELEVRRNFASVQPFRASYPKKFTNNSDHARAS